MHLNQAFLNELHHEAASTRKMLERIPAEHFDYKPHVKSMTLKKLATHIADLPSWFPFTINADGLDLATMNFTPKDFASAQELVAQFDANVVLAEEALKDATNEKLMELWTLRMGEHIVFTMPKAATLRSMVMNHLVHHRAQLSVYLRMLDIPVPGMYGPSADEK